MRSTLGVGRIAVVCGATDEVFAAGSFDTVANDLSAVHEPGGLGADSLVQARIGLMLLLLEFVRIADAPFLCGRQRPRE